MCKSDPLDEKKTHLVFVSIFKGSVFLQSGCAAPLNINLTINVKSTQCRPTVKL